jgi:hypothetical protein
VLTQSELTHCKLRKYMRSFASFHGINSNDDNSNISYHTRVEHVEKHIADDGQERGWILTLKKFVKTGPNSSKATWWTEVFNTETKFQSSLSLTVRNSDLMLLSLLQVASMLQTYRQSQDYLSGQSGFPVKFLIRGSTGVLSST